MSDEHFMTMISLVVARAIKEARDLSLEDVREWRQEAYRQRSRHDTVDAMLDPRRWQVNRAGVDAADEIAAAYLAFCETIERVKA